MTEATHFSQCVHDQPRRLEAEDCDGIRCAQLISGGRRRIRPPCTVPRSRTPHNVLHSPSTGICYWGERERAPHLAGVEMRNIFGASLSEPHIVVISITFSCPATSVCPIAYNRISTWKTGILRARAS